MPLSGISSVSQGDSEICNERAESCSAALCPGNLGAPAWPPPLEIPIIIHAVSIPSSAVPQLKGCCPKATAVFSFLISEETKSILLCKGPTSPLSHLQGSPWCPVLCGGQWPWGTAENHAHCDAFTSTLTFCFCLGPVWKKKRSLDSQTLQRFQGLEDHASLILFLSFFPLFFTTFFLSMAPASQNSEK